MQYYAHSTATSDKSDWQPLEEHLENVAALASAFASAFGAADWGRAGGLLHDLGKATDEFIQLLEGCPVRVNHSIYGARLGQKQGGRLGLLLSYIIAGHHGGLPDGGIQEGQLHYRLRHERIPENVAALSGIVCPSDLRLPFTKRPKHLGFSLALFTRMIFSCLTDADFLDTEAFCDPLKAQVRNGIQAFDPAALLNVLDARLAVLGRAASPSRVNTLRQTVLADCRARADNAPGFFSLTVPTGGGKTLASMTFALNHAMMHGLRRIIYAIPFTSIIEQNAQVFSEIFGRKNVLEHHCNYRDRGAHEEDEYDKLR